VIAAVASVKRIPEERVTIDSTFEEMGMDSLDAMNLLFELEEDFKISIPDQEAKSIRNVRAAVEGVSKLVAEKPAA
jgi:acyl carrier protein